MNMEPKNEDGWKIIFLLNWVTFRFQPFMFRGVFNMVACDSKLIPSKGSSHWRSRAMSSSTVWCITLRSMRSSLHNFQMPPIICRCQKEKVDMWAFEKNNDGIEKNAYTTKNNTNTPQSPVFCGEKGVTNNYIKVSILRFFGPEPWNFHRFQVTFVLQNSRILAGCSHRVWREAPGSSDLSVALKLVEGTLKLWCRYVQHG